MPKGLSTFALHTALQEPPASIRPEIDFAVQDATGKTDLSTLDPETVARRYLQNALTSPELPAFEAAEVNGQESEFNSLGVETILITNTSTVKFRQFYRKIPVYGSLVTIELNRANELVSISSALGNPTNVDPLANVSPAEALQIARQQAGYSATQYLDAIPKLYYYYDQKTQRWCLVYIIEDVPKLTTQPNPELEEAALPQVADYVIDAHSAGLVDELPRTQTANEDLVTEDALDGLNKLRQISVLQDENNLKRLHDREHNVHTYDFEFHDALFMGQQLPGKYITNPPAPWDGSGVSAHANAAKVATFLKTTLLRDGLDNQGSPVVSSINCIYQNLTGGRVWRNAAWFRGQMLYGQRLVEDKLISYAVAEDIVAHELFHGVTEHTARLEYRSESGALNESYSDIFGIIISNAHEPNTDPWNWQMGEDLSNTGVPIRDLSAPGKHGQPEHMRDFKILPEDREHDFGGVHTNSGIHNKAAFNILTAKDEQGSQLFDVISVARLFYLALTQELSRTSNFGDSRRGVLLRAATLFQNDPERDKKLSAIAKAFEDVGIS
jgi:Zn-dependent metalloprotease